MQNDAELIKNAILETLKYLNLHEPKCICEQCQFGYKYDKKSKIECKKRRQKTQENHNIWEKKILYWENKLIMENEKFEDSLFSKCIFCEYFMISMNPTCKITKEKCYDMDYCPLIPEDSPDN